MNDFIADLEAELVNAARRRATRRRLPRLRLAPAIAVAAVALAAITAVFVVGALDRSQTADERPAPPAGGGVLVTVPPALDATETKRCEHAAGWTTYAPLDPPLAVFTRPRALDDAIPGGRDWLPALYVPGLGSRRAGAGDLRLVPVVGPDCPDSNTAVESGVCLVAGNEGPVARCFSFSDVNAGRAVALLGPGRVAGIVPDGISRVEVDGIAARVVDNAYEVQLPGPAAGGQVRVRLAGAPSRCVPSPAAYDAVPALRLPPTRNPTRDIEVAMAGNGNRGAWRDSARRIMTPEGLVIWVVADEPCDRPSQYDEQVCLLPEGGALACETPATLARRGLIVRHRRDDRQVVAGVAPQGTRSVKAQVHDLVYPLALTGRVYGAALQAGPGEGVSVRFR